MTHNCKLWVLPTLFKFSFESPDGVAKNIATCLIDVVTKTIVTCLIFSFSKRKEAHNHSN